MTTPIPISTREALRRFAEKRNADQKIRRLRGDVAFGWFVAFVMVVICIGAIKTLAF